MNARGAHSLVLACLLGCTAGGRSPAPAPAGSPSNGGITAAGRVVLDTIEAPAIAANLYGDPPRVPVAVYLPPSYAASLHQRFPVLYVLHGYTHTLAGEPVPNPHTRWLLGPFGMAAIDSLIYARALRELIIVVPNATSRYGAGTFYTNSEAAGQWETFITRDLIGHVDRRYRTLVQSASRGIAGGSGGGYGAFKLAMKRPDLFGAVYAQSPCCLGTAALGYDEQAWRAALQLTRPDQVPDAAHPQAMRVRAPPSDRDVAGTA